MATPCVIELHDYPVFVMSWVHIFTRAIVNSIFKYPKLYLHAVLPLPRSKRTKSCRVPLRVCCNKVNPPIYVNGMIRLVYQFRFVFM